MQLALPQAHGRNLDSVALRLATRSCQFSSRDGQDSATMGTLACLWPHSEWPPLCQGVGGQMSSAATSDKLAFLGAVAGDFRLPVKELTVVLENTRVCHLEFLAAFAATVSIEPSLNLVLCAAGLPSSRSPRLLPTVTKYLYSIQRCGPWAPSPEASPYPLCPSPSRSDSKGVSLQGL